MKASLEQMKDMMAKVDPELQKKIDQLLKDKPLGDQANNKRMDLDKETLAERAERDKASSGGLPEDVRWALEDLASRLAQQSADRQTAKGNPGASQETGEKGMGSAQAETAQATAAEAAMQMVREAASEADAAKMMMGGGGMMGGDSRSGRRRQQRQGDRRRRRAADRAGAAQGDGRSQRRHAGRERQRRKICAERPSRASRRSASRACRRRRRSSAAARTRRRPCRKPVVDLLLKYFIRR